MASTIDTGSSLDISIPMNMKPVLSDGENARYLAEHQQALLPFEFNEPYEAAQFVSKHGYRQATRLWFHEIGGCVGQHLK